MQEQNDFITQVLETTEELVLKIEDREEIDPEWNAVREAAENLREELRALQ